MRPGRHPIIIGREALTAAFHATGGAVVEWRGKLTPHRGGAEGRRAQSWFLSFRRCHLEFPDRRPEGLFSPRPPFLRVSAMKANLRMLRRYRWALGLPQKMNVPRSMVVTRSMAPSPFRSTARMCIAGSRAVVHESRHELRPAGHGGVANRLVPVNHRRAIRIRIRVIVEVRPNSACPR